MTRCGLLSIIVTLSAKRVCEIYPSPVIFPFAQVGQYATD
jgi:hypothetical protein